MKALNLTDEEKQILLKYKKTSPFVAVRLKCEALLLYNSKVSTIVISEVTGRSAWSVYEWFKLFRSERLGSLFTGHENNQNASKLTRKQKLEISQVLKLPPSNHGIPKEFWDVPTLKEYTNTEFNTIYESKQSYHFLLRFSKMSFKYPDERSPRRDEKLIKQRIKEIRQEIKPMLDDDNCLVFTADETRLQYKSEIRRAWLRKGKRTVVKTERGKEKQNYLGFLDYKTNKVDLYEIESGNQEETIRVLQELVNKYKYKKICIIWDNAKWHKGKMLREQLQKNKPLENIHLINLPPYAPDTNPIEHVWEWAKGEIANRDSGKFDELKEVFSNNILSRDFNYKI